MMKGEIEHMGLDAKGNQIYGVRCFDTLFPLSVRSAMIHDIAIGLEVEVETDPETPFDENSPATVRIVTPDAFPQVKSA